MQRPGLQQGWSSFKSTSTKSRQNVQRFLSRKEGSQRSLSETAHFDKLFQLQRVLYGKKHYWM